MKTLIVFTTFALINLALAGNASMSSPESFVTPAGAVTAHALSKTPPSAARFSSRYTSLTNCGSGMTKKEEQEAEERGSDIPSRCKGPGGYDIFIGYSACSSMISAEKGADSFPLTTQAVDFLSEPPALAGGPRSKQKTIEWRMAQAPTNAKTKPFAVILRVYEYAGDDLCATGGKITGEFLIVKGLDGFEHIDEKINVKSTPNPNLKARQLADKKYGMSL